MRKYLFMSSKNYCHKTNSHTWCIITCIKYLHNNSKLLKVIDPPSPMICVNNSIHFSTYSSPMRQQYDTYQETFSIFMKNTLLKLPFPYGKSTDYFKSYSWKCIFFCFHCAAGILKVSHTGSIFKIKERVNAFWLFVQLILSTLAQVRPLHSHSGLGIKKTIL